MEQEDVDRAFAEFDRARLLVRPHPAPALRNAMLCVSCGSDRYLYTAPSAAQPCDEHVDEEHTQERSQVGAPHHSQELLFEELQRYQQQVGGGGWTIKIMTFGLFGATAYFTYILHSRKRLPWQHNEKVSPRRRNNWRCHVRCLCTTYASCESHPVPDRCKESWASIPGRAETHGIDASVDLNDRVVSLRTWPPAGCAVVSCLHGLFERMTGTRSYVLWRFRERFSASGNVETRDQQTVLGCPRRLGS